MINLFDNPVNTEDQEAVLAVKRLDQQNLQKFVNIVEAVRALRYIAKTNWYYAFAIDVDRERDNQNPLICGYQQTLEILQNFTKLEFTEITGQAVADVIDKIAEYRQLIERTIEKQVISENNTFTSDIAFARQVLPVLMMLMDAFSALYLESQRNVLATYELEALQDPDLLEEAEYHLLMDKVLRFSRLFLDNPSTSKALLGANLSEILEQSARFMASRGQSLITELSHSKNTTITA